MVEICGFFWVFHRKKFVGRSIASYVFSQFRDRHNERDEALDIIGKMKAAAAGRPGAPPEPNVVMCAIALARGEPFDSDVTRRPGLGAVGGRGETAGGERPGVGVGPAPRGVSPGWANTLGRMVLAWANTWARVVLAHLF